MLYVVSGVLAIYFHPFAVIVVFAPLGCVYGVKLLRGLNVISEERMPIAARTVSLYAAPGIIALCLALLLLPSIVRSPAQEFAARGVTYESLLGSACMLSGTAQIAMVIIFCGFLGLGQLMLLRRKMLLGIMLLCTVISYCVAMMITPWWDIGFPIVLLRFVIPVFPISFMLVGLGMDGLVEYAQSVGLVRGDRHGIFAVNCAIAIFLAALLYTGPLSAVYAYPNNFTNHFFFQESYQPLYWDRSYSGKYFRTFVVVRRPEIPRFYDWLSRQPNTVKVIEYPMMVCNHENIYYYYQHFHKKEVVGGYITNPDIARYIKVRELPETRLVSPSPWYFDYVMCKVRDKSKLKFRNMTDVMDINRLRRSGASFIILHKEVRRDKKSRDPSSDEILAYYPILYLSEMYKAPFGPPIFEDDNITVFKIPREGSATLIQTDHI